MRGNQDFACDLLKLIQDIYDDFVMQFIIAYTANAQMLSVLAI